MNAADAPSGENLNAGFVGSKHVAETVVPPESFLAAATDKSFRLIL